MRYAAIIEKAGAGFSGYIPDLPCCLAAGASVETVRRLLAEAVPFHIEGLKAAGEPVPGAESVVEWVEV
jgi:predicted RNase H-like HicB family nuclease